MAIQVGDVVKLKSGGPKMTVKEMYEGEWLCKWFDSDNETRCEPFAETTLEIVANVADVQPTEKSPYVDFSKV